MRTGDSPSDQSWRNAVKIQNSIQKPGWLRNWGRICLLTHFESHQCCCNEPINLFWFQRGDDQLESGRLLVFAQYSQNYARKCSSYPRSRQNSFCFECWRQVEEFVPAYGLDSSQFHTNFVLFLLLWSFSRFCLPIKLIFEKTQIGGSCPGEWKV